MRSRSRRSIGGVEHWREIVQVKSCDKWAFQIRIVRYGSLRHETTVGRRLGRGGRKTQRRFRRQRTRQPHARAVRSFATLRLIRV